MRQRLYQIIIAGLLFLCSCISESDRRNMENNDDQAKVIEPYTFIDSYVDDSTLTWNFRFFKGSDTILINTLSSNKPVNCEVVLIDSVQSNKLKLDYTFLERDGVYIGSATSWENLIITNSSEIWNLETQTKLERFDYNKTVISKSIHHDAFDRESTDTTCYYNYEIRLISENEVLINNLRISDSLLCDMLTLDYQEGTVILEKLVE